MFSLHLRCVCKLYLGHQWFRLFRDMRPSALCAQSEGLKLNRHCVYTILDPLAQSLPLSAGCPFSEGMIACAKCMEGQGYPLCL